ncbi:MAG: hypothetical protein FWB90_04945 [Fibromonadales bacterium]|nr:hypothetical protein [Fibromonadales bacterium]
MQKFIIFNDTAGRCQFINCLHLIRFEVKESTNISGVCVKFFLSQDKDIEWNKACDSVKEKIKEMQNRLLSFVKSDERVCGLE